MGEKVQLGEIQETTLIPLYGRALDARAPRSVLNDRKSLEMVEAIDYDFQKFTGPSLPGTVLRASIFDGYVRDFLRAHPEGTVADLGCGLSTRFDRLDNGTVRWFDLDVEDTMALRRKFFSDADRYTMLAGSIFGTDWHEAVLERGGPLFLLSEAVLLYFPQAQVHEVLRQFAVHFPAASVALDTGGRFMMGNQDKNPVFRGLSARMQWTCDRPRELESLGLRLLESRTFASPQPEAARDWPAKYRYGLKAIGWTGFVSTYKINLFAAGG
ncbi:O-methyltransferase domain protein [Segniliparus rotundus DSM 44985]|uniref:O-methyltransferase domain protein n=1 Tax=Segniliparus rotundus (strain ATCC BAA-972 / CDC 1076 / CIP 108378 / DSM 44985 / JCM 13578) TaxID=640132 RepID=D6Z7G1_SEGRD|nr:class I SAM-dependent methyltransferase [Segniliparus rotundus]ADG97891.1 O-methyltransferase domain protein [Segniliparus rotundus DSM 44985]